NNTTARMPPCSTARSGFSHHSRMRYTEGHRRHDTPEEGVTVCADVWTCISYLSLSQSVWPFTKQCVPLRTTKLLPSCLPGSASTACYRRKRFEPLQTWVSSVSRSQRSTVGRVARRWIWC